MKTKAVIFAQKNTIIVDDVILPEIADNEVLVDVAYSFISPGTERWNLTGKFFYGDKPVNRYPLVPGYQKTGTVKVVGKNVTAVKKGDRVFAPFSRFEDVTMWWGGHCSYSLNREEDLIKLPDNVDFIDAAALVILQVGYNGGIRPPVDPGDVAVVIGDGLIGQFVAQTLRGRGAYVIIAGKGDKERMQYAAKYSCDLTIDTAEVDLGEEVRKIVPDGAKIVVEAIGYQNNTETAMKLIANNGHYVLNGYYPGENKIDMNPVSFKEVTIYNPASFRRPRMLKALKLLEQNKYNVKSLVTHIVKSSDAVAVYENMVLNRNEFSLGIAIDWSDAK
jgi:2-desacetyl-2-hydroxyethyl bacteriochlorophyllide A dehydrogenase